MFKAAAIVLLVGLVVFVVMSLLIVSNVKDEVRALRAEVEMLRAAANPRPGAAEVAFEAETPPLATGPDGTAPQLVPLEGERPPRLAVVALVEVVGPDGTRTPVAANPVVLLPGTTGEIPVGPAAGCLTAAGSPPGAWTLSLEGNALKIAPRGCFYPRPIKGRLRGLIAR